MSLQHVLTLRRQRQKLIALIADPRHALAEDGTMRLSEAQARAILELRLARLTALGRDEIADALNKLAVEIADYLDILGSRVRLMGEAFGRAAQQLDQRVLFLASGGISHNPPIPR